MSDGFLSARHPSPATRHPLHLEGFEPPTYGSVGHCSIQLSYRCLHPTLLKYRKNGVKRQRDNGTGPSVRAGSVSDGPERPSLTLPARTAFAEDSGHARSTNCAGCPDSAKHAGAPSIFASARRFADGFSGLENRKKIAGESGHQAKEAFMSLMQRYWIGLAVGLSLSAALPNRGTSQETLPATLPPRGLTPVGPTALSAPQLSNQQLADAVAQALRRATSCAASMWTSRRPTASLNCKDTWPVPSSAKNPCDWRNGAGRRNGPRLVGCGQERAIVRVRKKTRPPRWGRPPEEWRSNRLPEDQCRTENLSQCWAMWSKRLPGRRRRHGQFRVWRRVACPSPSRNT